jgi:hypothetical protein
MRVNQAARQLLLTPQQVGMASTGHLRTPVGDTPRNYIPDIWIIYLTRPEEPPPDAAPQEIEQTLTGFAALPSTLPPFIIAADHFLLLFFYLCRPHTACLALIHSVPDSSNLRQTRSSCRCVAELLQQYRRHLKLSMQPPEVLHRYAAPCCL